MGDPRDEGVHEHEEHEVEPEHEGLIPWVASLLRRIPMQGADSDDQGT